MMKKTLSKVLAVSLALILCFSALTCGFVVSADGSPTLTLTPDKTSYTANDTATVAVTAAGWNGVIAGAQFTVTGVPAGATILDKDGAAWANKDDYAVSYDAAAETVSFLSYSNANFAAIDSTLFKIQFTSGEGTVDLGIKTDEDSFVFCDADEKDITVTATGATLTFAAAVTCTHNWVPESLTTAKGDDTAGESEKGSITLKCSKCSETQAPAAVNYNKSAVLATPTIGLSSAISLEMRVNSTKAPKNECYVVLTHVYASGNRETTYLSCSEATLNSNNYYVWSVEILSKQLTDSIETIFVSKNSDGEWENGRVRAFTVQERAMSVVNGQNDTAATKKLAAHLLNYGAKAQVYDNYGISALADAELTADQKIEFGITDASGKEIVASCVKDNTNYIPTSGYSAAGKAGFPTPSLALGSATEINLKLNYANYAGDKSNIQLKYEFVAYTGNTVSVTVPTSELSPVEGYTSAQRMGYMLPLVAGNLRAKVKVTILNGDVAISDTATYSIEAILKQAYDNSQDENLHSLINSLLNYCDAAMATVSNS